MSETPLLDFGAAIRAVRESRGLSQEELAFAAGLHRTYVSSVERGQRNVSLLNIWKLSKALGVRPGDLLNHPRRRSGHADR